MRCPICQARVVFTRVVSPHPRDVAICSECPFMGEL